MTTWITITAFAEDAVIGGELVLDGDRLSDFIPQDGPFEIERVALDALDDGRRVVVPTATLARRDLIALAGSGPRGNKAKRVRTRSHPVRVKAGPYEIVGYVHAAPSADPFSGLLRRRVLAVTSAMIRYRVGGHPVEDDIGTLLVNPERIDWIKTATDEDLSLAKTLQLAQNVDLGAKDLTGDLMTDGYVRRVGRTNASI